MTAHVLIVEDDPNTSSLVETYLAREGYRTLTTANGQEAVALARRHSPDFIVLDIMLPGKDGWDICKELRTFTNAPILILTAREEEIDRILGLSLGADDYVIKPFSPRELVARVKAILRRSRGGQANTENIISFGDLKLDCSKQKVSLAGEPVNLTALEYRILKALMRSPGRIFSRNELLEHCYPDGEVVIDRVVDVHIGKLRQKIERQPSQPSYIMTNRGFGYSFAEKVEP